MPYFADDPPPARLMPKLHYPGLERLMCMALADDAARAALITNPSLALDQLAAPLGLTSEECALVLAAAGPGDLHAFADRLYTATQQAAGPPKRDS